MSPSASSTGPATTRPGQVETTRFRCACGRSVATQRGSEADESGRCSSCRARQRDDAPLHRT